MKFTLATLLVALPAIVAANPIGTRQIGSLDCTTLSACCTGLTTGLGIIPGEALGSFSGVLASACPFIDGACDGVTAVFCCSGATQLGPSCILSSVNGTGLTGILPGLPGL